MTEEADQRNDPAAPSPRAPRRPHTWKRPTGDVDDPYAWMRQVDDPDLLTYLEAENGAAERFFEPHTDTIETIFGEIRSRVQETDLSTPVEFGPWWYVTSTTEAKSYPVHHRGPTADRATDRVLLDENVEADGHEYFDLGAFDVSMDHRFVAWSMDTAGDEHYTLRIRDLDTGDDLDDQLDDTSSAGVAWSHDGQWLFYVTPDAQERPATVWRHRIGTPRVDDICVFDEADERFFVGIGSTRSDSWIVIHSASRTSSETRLLATIRPTDEPIVVLERRPDVEYGIDHWGDQFVMHTNDDAVDFRLLTAPVGADLAQPASWTELTAHHPGRRILGAEAFASHLVIHEWADAQPRLRVLFRDRTERVIDLGDDPHDVEPAANPQWETNLLRFTVQSLTMPTTLYDEDLTTGERTLLRRIPTPAVDLDLYRTRRLWATAADGTQVPLDIVHHVDTQLDGTAPGVLYGYGAYEASMPPWFSVARLSLLDRGFVWALAHPRGGGELGRQWYLDGRLLAKPNTFGDTIACGEHLISERIVDGDRLAIRGGSAGGLLVAACMTQRPDLFCSVVAEVPFVDVVSTMSDPTLPLTVTEWEEWGDPRVEPYATCILGYSPYDNTVAADYPAVYATAGLNDPRVSVHEPAKWIARLRDVSTGSAPIVLRTELGAGHGGPTGRYDAWRDEARTLAFILATT
ncbi:MAG TPA: S9 family peptidase [Ilumatobacteraceae bacterium]|nr:S9 family peptidase [Ilumatobacteraceae bacterium]